MQIGPCKLCLRKKPLLKKSHIIPEFMYTGMYDEKHQMLVGIPHEIFTSDKKLDMVPSGEYEGGLLCADCDNDLIGHNLETYARSVIYGGRFSKGSTPDCKNFRAPNGLTFARCKNIDYRKFKLFLLSILWRASISSRSFFSDVNLGPYEEVIRRMLLVSNPGNVEDFPILLITWLNDSNLPKELIGQPCRARDEGGIHYIFPIGGVVYLFYVSPNAMSKRLLPFTLLPSNEMSLLQVPLGEGWDFVRALLKV